MTSKLVPVEPTEEMEQAGVAALMEAWPWLVVELHRYGPDYAVCPPEPVVAAFQAMLTAAPAEQPSRDAVPDLNVECPECEGIIGNWETTNCSTCPRLVIDAYRAIKAQPTKRNTSIRDEISTPECNAMLKELRLRSKPAGPAGETMSTTADDSISYSPHRIQSTAETAAATNAAGQDSQSETLDTRDGPNPEISPPVPAAPAADEPSSRSQLRRVAAMKGETAPTFDAPTAAVPVAWAVYCNGSYIHGNTRDTLADAEHLLTWLNANYDDGDKRKIIPLYTRPADVTE